MYALVLETDGFEFLIDPRDLWKPPRLVVRRGWQSAEVWLDENDVSFLKPSRFSVRDQTLILRLVRENIDDLSMSWMSLKNDVRMGRLERNALVE
ncbi:MAG: hypothetical protein ACT443_15385 [Gemmatimonadota bacterium]